MALTSVEIDRMDSEIPRYTRSEWDDLGVAERRDVLRKIKLYTWLVRESTRDILEEQVFGT